MFLGTVKNETKARIVLIVWNSVLDITLCCILCYIMDGQTKFKLKREDRTGELYAFIDFNSDSSETSETEESE